MLYSPTPTTTSPAAATSQRPSGQSRARAVSSFSSWFSPGGLARVDDEVDRDKREPAVHQSARRVRDASEIVFTLPGLELASEDCERELPERVAGEADSERGKEDAAERVLRDFVQGSRAVLELAAATDGHVQGQHRDEAEREPLGDQPGPGETLRPRARRGPASRLLGICGRAHAVRGTR